MRTLRTLLRYHANSSVLTRSVLFSSIQLSKCNLDLFCRTSHLVQSPESVLVKPSVRHTIYIYIETWASNYGHASVRFHESRLHYKPICNIFSALRNRNTCPYEALYHGEVPLVYVDSISFTTHTYSMIISCSIVIHSEQVVAQQLEHVNSVIQCGLWNFLSRD